MLVTIDLQESIKTELQKKIPSYLIKQRAGGGNRNFNYISGVTCIDKLNTIFNYNWDWKIDNCFVQQSVPNYTKYHKNNNLPPEEQPPVAHVIGTLTVKLRDQDSGELITIQKSAAGSKVVLGKAEDQQHIFKAASTDALKKAASLIGIATDLYRDEDEQGYYDYVSYINNLSGKEREEYDESMRFLNDVMKNNGVSKEELDSFLYDTSNGKYSDIDVVDINALKKFIEQLKGIMSNSNKGEA